MSDVAWLQDGVSERCRKYSEQVQKQEEETRKHKAAELSPGGSAAATEQAAQEASRKELHGGNHTRCGGKA